MRCVRAVAGMLALGSALALALPGAASALQHDAPAVVGPPVAGVPFEFVLFGLTLLGVAFFHRKTLQVALAGLAAISLYKIFFVGFTHGSGAFGFLGHLGREWVVVANLFLLLTGFALLANQFERTGIPRILPRYLPDDWKGAFALLVMVFVLSSFLDNIAAALVGGAIAHTVFERKVHLGYLAAIVAAANAGGSGSVIGDTTTTMMWISGISPLAVLHAYVAATAALVVFGVPASIQQDRHSRILRQAPAGARVDGARIAVVAIVLGAAIATNVVVNLRFPERSEAFPYIGVAVWLAILATAGWRRAEWNLLPEAAKGSIFLLALVLAATMMPVERLPPASWQVAMGLGFLSSVFGCVPLTALALRQGGYDWGVLAYAVGFGGSMIWFGSAAGIAISNLYPEAKSVGRWLWNGWHVTLAYIVGFFVLLLLLGWQP